MLVKVWHQAYAVLPHDPSRFIAVFVILESVIDWDSCHADIDARLEWIAFGIQPQNRRMLCDGITQQNHVDVVVKRLFLRKPSALRFQPREMILSSAAIQG